MLFGGNARLLAGRPGPRPGHFDRPELGPALGLCLGRGVHKRKQAVRQVLPLVDLVHGNVRELTLFADAPDLTTALERLTGWGAKAVVVHLGAKGAGYYWHDGLIVEPSARPGSRSTPPAPATC